MGKCKIIHAGLRSLAGTESELMLEVSQLLLCLFQRCIALLQKQDLSILTGNQIVLSWSALKYASGQS
jgi:hypothetical protein